MKKKRLMQVMLLLISMFVVGICFFYFSLKKMNSKLIEKSYNYKRGEFKQIKLSDINAQSEGLKMICADRTAKYWQISEGKCYTMQSDGDRNYIVLCNGNTIGGFSLSIMAQLSRQKFNIFIMN